MPRLDSLDPATIRAGEATDAYFLRTEEALAAAGRDPTVVAEVTADQFPTGEFEVLAGLSDVAALFEGVPVDVDALPPGQCFDGGPVLQIEGRYRAFARFETALLGVLSQASAYATRALRARRAAPDSQVLSFGSRHIHPSIAPVLERAALVGGLDGISNVAAGERLGEEAGGTMPHALLMIFGEGNQAAGWKAFDEGVGPDVPRVALVDTFYDETVEAREAAEALGDALDAVRIDTTGSRRGDFRHIVREVRFELDAEGHEDVGIFVSGGIDREAMVRLRDHVEGFGVGSYLTSAAPIDFALDVVEVDGDPVSKRGKLPGRKAVHRTPDGGHHVALADAPAPEGGNSLLEPLVRDGEVVGDVDLESATDRARADAERVGFGVEAGSGAT
ncbi:nicotinate phosphoribosyltransferase [Salinarchaeum sp. Harcht-Bsk1]|uniref:nicotinate phosphoribosyltransferase n=1 Tax=Salinarchaeum sp. Harcht-Bsk1 TaxID=1333523 RepID=UPI00034238FD|nr:nicotinate phosphoribosyltransferase [Salinarchaeum sp. Harcht-Bsk1]AGN02105.1 nicotinate phosphoribosyltransferase [Salinarchaeum sp. Harcht-Bsk1]